MSSVLRSVLRLRSRRALALGLATFASLVASLAGWPSGPAHAATFDRSTTPPPPPPPSTEPVHVFVQLGTGLVEIANVKLGAFLGPHVSVEAMAAWDGVYDSRFGGGVTGIIGHASGPRPPRHALLVGARLMLNREGSFDSGGDDLSSYLALPVGYGYLANNGFYLTGTLGPVIVRERQGSGAEVSHHWTLGGVLFNAAAGLAF